MNMSDNSTVLRVFGDGQEHHEDSGEEEQVVIRLIGNPQTEQHTDIGAKTNNSRYLLYKISDSPPFILTAFFGLQLSLMTVIWSIILPTIVAKAVCADGNLHVQRQLTSSTLLMNGVTTLVQVAIGVRLPVFQGAAGEYVAPLVLLSQMNSDYCGVGQKGLNDSEQIANETDEDIIYQKIRELTGPLMLAGLVHFLIGATGLVGLLLNFIGPVTIVPTILLIGMYLVKPALDFAEIHMGVSIFTWAVGLVMTLYLSMRQMPLPFFTRQKGFHFVWFPLHQVLGVLISVLAGWGLCTILTYAGVLTDDKSALQYQARSDARIGAINDSPWFYLPYPGQFGSHSFSTKAFVSFMVATLTSILDSIGDYYATANMCRVPPPPSHALNRGIAVEGLCSILSGALGCGHATTTYGEAVGTIGLTRVASRRVLYMTGVIFIVIGIMGKVSAVFVSIPYPVLGGAMALITSVFVGVNLSNLNVLDLTSVRNLTIIGMGIFIGLLVPAWVEKNGDTTITGHAEADHVIRILLSNPNLVGAVLACTLDNTVPGTDEERGIAAWKRPEMVTLSNNTEVYLEGSEVYKPLIHKRILQHTLMKYIPMCPYLEAEE